MCRRVPPGRPLSSLLNARSGGTGSTPLTYALGMRFSAVQFLLFSAFAIFVVDEAQAASTKAKAKAKATVPAPPAPEPEPEPAPEPAPEPKPVAPEPEAEVAAAPPVIVPPAGPRPWLVFLEGGFHWDLGTFSRSENVGLNQNNNNDEINSLGPMVTLGVLSRVSDVWRVGGAFGYGGNWDLNNSNQLLGQLLTADFRLEAGTQVADHFWLFAQPKVGLTSIIPGGILQDRITANQQFGFDTWSGPRWGFLIGADAGGRYMLNDWLSLRATVGYAWTMSFLLDSHASSPQVSASQTWQVQASRLSGNLGLEASF